MAPPSNEFLKSEVDRLTAELDALKAAAPDKNAQALLTENENLRAEVARLNEVIAKTGPGFVSEGQKLADIMREGRQG
jgi:regulator of replication initiation timing